MLQRKSVLWYFRKTFGILTRISMHFLQSNILSFCKYLLGHELWRLFKRIRTYILFIKLMKHWFCVTFSLNWSSGECYKRTCTTARILILLLHIFPYSEGMAHCLNNVDLSKCSFNMSSGKGWGWGLWTTTVKRCWLNLTQSNWRSHLQTEIGKNLFKRALAHMS